MVTLYPSKKLIGILKRIHILIVRDNGPVGELHDNGRVIRAPVEVHKQPRIAAENRRTIETVTQLSRDFRASNVVGNVPVEFRGSQTERAIAFRQSVGRVITDDQEIRTCLRVMQLKRLIIGEFDCRLIQHAAHYTQWVHKSERFDGIRFTTGLLSHLSRRGERKTGMPLHDDPRGFLLKLFDAAVRAAQPETCLPPHLPAPPPGRLVILAAGKAAAAMAATAENYYSENWPETKIEGIALTRYGHTCPTRFVEVMEAGHPVPDEAGVIASRAILELAHSLTENDLGLVLLSGGASALLTLPVRGMSLGEKQDLTRELLGSGAPIDEINTVRRHFSQIKGGRLAAAIYPARCVTCAISDVTGDRPDVIASGPTVSGITSSVRVTRILERNGIRITPQLELAMKSSVKGPLHDAPCFDRADYSIIATGAKSLSAAAAIAREAGCEVSIIGDRVEGDAVAIADSHARMARSHTNPGVPRVILSGGEATVQLGETYGVGGPNQHFALALALALNGERNVHAVACDTDGIDGGSGRSDDPAGAVISSRTLERAAKLRLDPEACLAACDSGTLFEKLGDLVCTGPTLTNVNDFRAILISG